MKVVFTLVFAALLSFTSYAQLGISLAGAEDRGISIPRLDSTYQSGIHSDPDLAVFGDQQNEYIQAYYALIRDLTSYLNTNDFRWGGQTRCFNRIYFNPDGTIEYFIYEFEEGEISDERKEQFEQLLNEFIVDTKFPLSKNVRFAQCSPVNYRDTL